jgi:putative phosphoribosyl transferase
MLGAMSTSFRDRTDAGRRLARAVARLHLSDPVVLGLPRGGVPVAREVASALGAPLDVLVVRKVGAPGNPEFGVGAIGEGGVEVLDDETLSKLRLTRDALVPTIEAESVELRRRVTRYRRGAPPVEVAGRDAIVVDDGLATGVSATAAVRVLRRREPRRIVLAVPVGSPRSLGRLRPEVDDVVVLHAPESFRAVGSFYRDFGQTSDDEVAAILQEVGGAPHA